MNVLMRTVLLIAAAAALAIAIPRAQSKLMLKIDTGRGQTGYDVNSTMISGEKDMLASASSTSRRSRRS